ncbi:MAG: VWA domain-containing protein [Chitinivibrionales bacterium]|nr:VWA domain-containing protein [Chitinivibrionales bacterium]
MRFGSPYFFWLLVLIPVLIAFFIWSYQRKQAALGRFASSSIIAKLTPDAGLNRQVVKWFLYIFFMLFLIIALVRPQFGVKMEMIERRGVDIIVGLDISQSMLAEDVAPNRLERAKHETIQFINLLKGDRIGLIVFAGESFMQCPLTLDYAAAQQYLSAVTTDWIQLQGTALSDVIQQALRAFKTDVKKHKVLILISDGEDHEGNSLEAAKEARKQGVIIYTVGIGSSSGVPIPLTKKDGNVVYKKDESNNLVMTRLDPMTLEKIAVETNGRYFDAGTNVNLSLIYDEIAKMEKKDLGMNKVAVYEERYQIFLFIAILLLLIDFIVPERIHRKVTWRGRFE